MVVLMMLCASPALPAVGAGADTIEVFPVVVDDLGSNVAGRPTQFNAVAVDGGSPMSGVSLELWLQPAGSTRYLAGEVTTGPDGSAAVSTTIDRNATVQWALSSDASVTSTPYVVQIAPALTRHANDRTLRRGQRLVVRGHTSPAKPGCAVELWRGELRPLVLGPKPVRLARSTVRADGSYRLTRRFHRHLRARIAVVIPACGDNGRGLSAYLGLRVR